MNAIVAKPTFDGFLTAVYESYYTKKETEMITANTNALTLLDNFSCCDENRECADKVRRGILKRGGRKALDEIFDAYRSGDGKKEQVIFKYLQLYFKYGEAVREMYGETEVIEFNDILRKVHHEIHRLTAFTRLQEMKGGVFYSWFESDNDIIDKVLPHLAMRYNTERIVLHDVRRKKMGFYDGSDCYYTDAPDKVEIELSESESFFQKIWSDYHKNVSIKERRNERLQNGFAPKKYRAFMHEFNT